MKNILVGADGSPASRNAAQWAANLAEQTGARLTQIRAVTAIKTVAPDLGLFGMPPVAVGVDGGNTGVGVLVGGEPGPVLLAEGDRRYADLIVAGSHVHDMVEGLVPWSVMEYLSRHTQRPLLLVPVSAEPAPIRSILLGVSGTMGEQPVIDAVAELATSLDAQVSAVHVFHRPAEFWIHRDPRSQWSKTRRLFEEVWTEPLRAAGVLGEVRMVDGVHVAAALEQAAQELNCDIVAAGIGRSGPVDLHRMTPMAAHLTRHELHRPFLQIPYRVDRHLSPIASRLDSENPDHRPTLASRAGTAAR